MIVKGESLFLKANELHSVSCSKDNFAAWLVYEGKEDSNYKSFCYFDGDINRVSDKGLYEKPSKQRIKQLLIRCKLLD